MKTALLLLSLTLLSCDWNLYQSYEEALENGLRQALEII